MWNKLFNKNKKEKQLNLSNNKSDSDVADVAEKPPTPKKFFSFLKGKKSKVDRYKEEDNFNHFLQYETKVFTESDFDKKYQHSQLYQPQQHQQPDDHQQLNEIFIDIPPSNLRLDLCPVCSRKFAPDALMKHVIICEKINTKTRKPFDSSKQRLQGTEFTGVVASSPTIVASRQPIKFESRVSPPKTLQRKASETSLKSQPMSSSERYTMMSNMSRKNSTMSLGGTPRMKRSVSHQNEKCPYCERVFGYKAYDRHVEWCKEKSLIKGSPDVASVSAAKERMKTRINYRAPNLKTKRGATRDKYSNSCNGSTNSLADFDSHLNSMSSSMTSDTGLYDPFLSAKKQLEELFSPTTTPTTQMINSMMAAPSTTSNNSNKSNNLMSKSLTLNHVIISPKTPQPIPKMQNNFKRTSSLRLSNRKPKPTIFTPPVKSNIHCGITDDGPISPSFVKATDYDELPIKSPYSAIKLVEKSVLNQQRNPPSQMMPVIDDKPLLRDNMLLVRKNLKLDLRNRNSPGRDYELSKTDSLALFLKYESELTAKLSEKELKDQSNSLSKRTNATTNSFALKDNKLPDINSKPIIQQQTQPQKLTTDGMRNEDRPLISIDNLNRNPIENMNRNPLESLNRNLVDNSQSKSHSAPVKLNNASDNLPSLTNVDTSDASRSPSIGRKSTEEDSPSSSRRSGSSTLRRKKKYNMDNILFDTDPDPSASLNNSDNSTNNSKDNSLILPEPQSKNPCILDDFDFDNFIASFQDDDQFPIFKDYKMLLKSTSNKADDDNNNIKKKSGAVIQPTSPPKLESLKLSGTSKPILIQPQQRSESEISELEKLDNLCKMLSGNSDSDESNSYDTYRSESQSRSKSSADSAYGSLSRQSQSPFDHRKMSAGSMNTFRPTPPPPPVRQHLELKKTEIVLNPIKTFNHHEPAKTSVQLSQANNSENDQLSKFCHDCGYKFVVPTAKFCIECGVRRIKMTN